MLKDPNERAIYILKLKGIDFEKTLVNCPELLIDILEKRELLEETELSVPQLREMLRENEQNLQLLFHEIGDCFQRDDFEGAKTQLSKIQYLTTLSKEIKMKLPVT